MGNTGFLLVFIATAACLVSRSTCQLKFTAQQRPQGVEMVCSIGNLTSTSFHNLESLFIFKVTGFTRHIVASISAHYDHGDPISHLPDAQVTGHLSNDDNLKRYLRIWWSHSKTDLDGNYICDLNYADQDYIPLLMTKNLTLNVKSLCPCFWASPVVFQVGLTKQLDVICSVPDPASINISQLASLEIIRFNNGVKQILAEINYESNVAIVHDSSDRTAVNGSIHGNDAYLQVVWTYPTAETSSEYACEGSGVGIDGTPIIFSRHLNVSFENPDPEELVDRLFELYDKQKDYEKCQDELEKLTNTRKPETSSQTPSEPSSMPTSQSTSESSSRPTSQSTSESSSRPTSQSTSESSSRPTSQSTSESSSRPTSQSTSESSSRPTSQSTSESSSRPTSQSTSAYIYPKGCDNLNFLTGEYMVMVDPGDGIGPMQVLCRSFGTGNVWTVLQKRFDGSVDFYRNFSEYRSGFGSVYGEFWLGLDNVRRLLVQNGDNNSLLVELKELQTLTTYTKGFPIFSIGPGDGYMLVALGGADDHGFGLSVNNGQNFSTFDHGNTRLAASNNRAAGWWFPMSGGFVNINGKWGTTGETSTMDWYEFRMSFNFPMGATEMMFRKNDK